MSVERSVAQHYAHGRLGDAIREALVASGKDLDHLTPTDLAPVDEFHIGGRKATIEFAAQLGLRSGLHLLDIGSGLGGTSRYLAHELGCRVTGIDLTADYVEIATELARRVGLDHLVSYQEGSALALPYNTESFDGATMLHVGMNIADKAALFVGVRRVLHRQGVFGIYDVMRLADGALSFPVPWAASAETSFVETQAAYRQALRASGFEIFAERDRRDFAIEFFRQMRARASQGGPPPLGLHIVMGADFPQKIANMIGSLERGLIAPVEMICRAT